MSLSLKKINLFLADQLDNPAPLSMSRMGLVRVTLVAMILGLVTVSLVSAQCSPSPCGVNTNCEINRGGAAVCR